MTLLSDLDNVILRNGVIVLNRLPLLRQEGGFTQKQLAALLNVQDSAISKYETGRVSLSDDLIHQLCEIFDVSADYILGISNKRERTAITDADLKMALFGTHEVDDDILSSVREFAEFAAVRKKKG
jgi:transcriptional regulator with XRE-family HTH domain